MGSYKINGVWASNLNTKKRKRRSGEDYSDTDIKRDLKKFLGSTIRPEQIDAIWTKFKDILIQKFIAREPVVFWGIGHFDFMLRKGRWFHQSCGPIKSERHWQPDSYFLVFRPGTALRKLMIEQQKKELPQGPPPEHPEPALTSDVIQPATVAGQSEPRLFQ